MAQFKETVAGIAWIALPPINNNLNSDAAARSVRYSGHSNSLFVMKVFSPAYTRIAFTVFPDPSY